MKDKSNSLELFYSDSSHLLIDDWANIVHSIVTYADKIWLNEECCFFKKAFQHNDDFRGLSSTIADLRDAGIIKTWQLMSIECCTKKLVNQSLICLKE
jgi:hypothetical protein